MTDYYDSIPGEERVTAVPYTPTTTEVREAYRLSVRRPDVCGSNFGAEFDRWLDEFERAAKESAYQQGWNDACEKVAQAIHATNEYAFGPEFEQGVSTGLSRAEGIARGESA